MLSTPLQAFPSHEQMLGLLWTRALANTVPLMDAGSWSVPTEAPIGVQSLQEIDTETSEITSLLTAWTATGF